MSFARDGEPDRMVPKVHPLTREIEQEDPMELIAMSVQGDPDVMLECMVQEFAGLGWNTEQLLMLFQSPDYPVLNQLLAALGESEVRRRVQIILGQVGIFQVTESIAEEEGLGDVLEDEPEVVHVVQIAPLPARKGGGFQDSSSGPTIADPRVLA